MKPPKPSFERFLAAFWRDESGAIMLETALVFPIQLLLTLFIVQAGLIWSAANVLNYGAFQAARTVMIEMRGPAITDEVRRKAWAAAYVVTSSLANPVHSVEERARTLPLRLLHHEYYMPRSHFLGNNRGLEVSVGYYHDQEESVGNNNDQEKSVGNDNDQEESVDNDDKSKMRAADAVVVAAVRYYFPLTVPLAGGIIGMGVRGNILQGVRYIPMEQVVRLAKPWPY